VSDDLDDFDGFFRRDYVSLIGFLCKVGFDREEARDAAAEAMTLAFRCWLELKSPRAWVRTVAYRIALGQARRDREGVHRAIASWSGAHVDGQEAFRVVEERLRIVELLDLLPPQQRRAMAWRLDGFEISEIAEQMEVSDATVRSTLRHARLRLQYALKPARRDQSEGGVCGDQ
jgi:RNA polymerase sigma factor (sigma-70 family)